VWSKDGESNAGREKITKVPPRALVEDFNIFGVEVTADWTTFYWNGEQVWRTTASRNSLNPCTSWSILRCQRLADRQNTQSKLHVRRLRPGLRFAIGASQGCSASKMLLLPHSPHSGRRKPTKSHRRYQVFARLPEGFALRSCAAVGGKKRANITDEPKANK
jgi:hypothetical protein